MDLCAADVSAVAIWAAGVWGIRAESRGLDAGALELDDRLSAVGPALLGGDAEADAGPQPERRAAGESRRRGCVRLAVSVWRRGGALAVDRRAGEGDARVSGSRRVLHVRRFPRGAGVGDFRGEHASRV